MLQATKHQGNVTFRGNGRQCVANAASAILMCREKIPSTWDQSTLDEILILGDALYVDSINQKPSLRDVVYLTAEDLPEKLIKVSENVNGTIHGPTSVPFYSLKDGIEKLINHEDEDLYCIFTMGNTEPCYSSALIRHRNLYYFFDPHSRSDTGMQSADGFATLTVHTSHTALCLFIQHLAASLNQKGVVPFDLSKITFASAEKRPDTATDSESESSDFSGFESISKGEVTCRLCMAQEILEHCHDESYDSDVSDVSSSESEKSQFAEVSDSNAFAEHLDDAISKLNDSTNFINSIDTNVFDELAENETVKKSERNCKLDGKTDPIHFTNSQKYVVNNESYSNKAEDTCSKDVEENTNNTVNEHEISNNEMDQEESRTIYDGDTDGYEVDENFLEVSNTMSDKENAYFDSSGEEFIPPSTSSDESDNMLLLSFTRKKIKSQNLKKKKSASLEKVEVFKETVTEVQKRLNPISETDCNFESRGRKRKRKEQNWKCNIAKRRRAEGKSYINKLGRVKKAKILKDPCGACCKFRCMNKYTNEERETIFHKYWGYGDTNKQTQFIIKHVQKKEKKRNKNNLSRRRNSYIYTMPHAEQNTSDRVCKRFFLNTLDITDQKIITAHKKNELGVAGSEKRGTSVGSRHNKTTQIKVNAVKEHIRSFKAVASHYCRKDTSKTYLSPNLNVREMFRQYKSKCQQSGNSCVSEQVYRNIFNTNFNISFHTPKKDQCDLCATFLNSSAEDRALLKDEYEKHIQNKNLSFANKDADKLKACSDQELCVACFDLEQVLPTPKAFESGIYYKRQLNNYNFTVYDFATSDGFAYIWNETTAARGGCEIASFVFQFIQTKVAEGKQKFIFYSDNCVPQNKNRHYLSMLWYAMHKFNLSSVQHKYFEKGHTRNENDSMHSTIENKSRKISIYTTAQWATLIQTARRDRPYIVKEMSLTDFFDFRELSEKIRNFEVDDNNRKAVWAQFKTLKLSADTPNSFLFQYNYGGLSHFVDLFSKTSRRGYTECVDTKSYSLKQLRKELVPISVEKYNDLINLCVNDIISKVHHVFYALLPHSAAINY